MSASQPNIKQKGRSKARSEPMATATAEPADPRRRRPSAVASASASDRKIPSRGPSDNPVCRVNFEVRGKVQGVHFRKYTQMKGTSFGLRGWCQNTNYSTVIGCMEGPRNKIEQMKQWLKSTGSPKSIITGADFKEVQLAEYTLSREFKIIK